MSEKMLNHQKHIEDTLYALLAEYAESVRKAREAKIAKIFADVPFLDLDKWK